MPNNILSTLLQEYVHLSRYSRWIEEEKRRESFEETLERYYNYLESKFPEFSQVRKELEETNLNLGVFPSMRGLMTAGPALERDPMAIYNCSFVAVNKPTAFDEIMYTLMLGTGVGFSVERQHINKLPEIASEFHSTDTTIVVADSRTGWCKAFKELIHLLYGGNIPNWDTSKVRGSGERLKTFGGRASGPAPLEELFEFTVQLFKNAAGRKLSSVECHDLVCKIASVIVVGGVRRSALISLSNLSDDRMRIAKSGQWWVDNVQRALANNSAVYTEKPDMGIFMKEWLSLYESKSGERGVFNRYAIKSKFEKDEMNREYHEDMGTNPCGEIILRPEQLCNLSEVVVRANDDLKTLKEKVRKATIIGTFQSMFTDFRYVNKKWRKNCEEERLLGVSLTGIMDNVVTSGQQGKQELIRWLQELRKTARETNNEWADRLGIPRSAAITCVKPSGTLSSLVDSAAGIHPRHSEYYIRSVRNDKKDPVSNLMIDEGIPYEEDVTNPSNLVFYFPIKSPDGAITRKNISAIEHLEIWKVYRQYWCDHNPSITVSVKEKEWMEVGSWVYENFDEICGISFLPYSDHVYKQAPYMDCTKEEYEKLYNKMPKEIDWSKLSKYELVDSTTSSKELSCAAGGCDI